VGGLGLVVLDEVHYLQDPYRGSVWEELIILLPADVTLVCLSATVSNAGELGAWMESVRGTVAVVLEEHRPVELHNHVAMASKGTRRIDLVPLLEGGRLHPRARTVDERVERMRRRAGGLRHAPFASPRRTELVEALSERAMLPAIVFIFSRAACEDAVAQCLSDGVRLTTAEERREIRRRCERRTEGLSDDELRVLGYGPWLAGLEVGVAPHHAGMIPAFREAVEDCFGAGLLRVVFATETLALGINMPARTVVIERLTKVRQHGRSGLTSGEYAQMTGRAGRRGLDVLGHAVVPWTPQLSLGGLAALATSPAPELVSSFRPTYNLAVNLVRRYPAEQAHDILDRSFAQFRDRRHRHALSRRLDAALALLERWGHVELGPWRLTERGATLARIYHESDLLVAEALADGLFDQLSPPVLAGVVSGCTFEARAGRSTHERGLPKSIVGPFARLEALAERLRSDEEAHHLPRTRRVDGSLAGAFSAWAGGERLERVLERAELPAGDFVRNAKQLIDLLRQLAMVAPVRATGETAGAAAAGLERGVVAASAGPALAHEAAESDPSSPADPAVPVRLAVPVELGEDGEELGGGGAEAQVEGGPEGR
jgi:superfamily II RNA helicase